DAGHRRARLLPFHRPLLVASDPLVPATIRVGETSVAAWLPRSPRAQVATAPPPTVRLAGERQADVPEDPRNLADLQQTRWRPRPDRGRRRGRGDGAPASPSPSGEGGRREAAAGWGRPLSPPS